MSTRARTIVVVSEMPLVREALEDALRKARFRRVVTLTPSDPPSHCLRGERLALALVDLYRLGRTDTALTGWELIADIRRTWRRSIIVAIGSRAQIVARAVAADVWLESTAASRARVIEIVRAVLRGRRDIFEASSSPAVVPDRARWGSVTARERQVLGLLSDGRDNLKIAAHLGITERAIKSHVSSLLKKLGADNRTELAVAARDAGFVAGAPDLYLRTR